MKECPYCRKVACVCEKPAHVPDRLAALEQRVGALEARAEDSDAEPCDDPELRALNAQIDRDCNVESTESHMLLDENGIAPAPVGTRNCKRLQRRIEFMIATLATARRERDEAVSVVRRCAVGLGDPCKRDCSHDACWVISEARALVAGQGEDPRQNLTAECEMWKDQARDAEQLRSDRAARDAEIAGLRARVAELEARDRLLCHAIQECGHGTTCDRVWQDGRGTPPADPARGLIERVRDLTAIVVDFLEGKMHAALSLQQSRALLADLRAYLGGGT